VISDRKQREPIGTADDPGIAANNIRCHYAPKGAAATTVKKKLSALITAGPGSWMSLLFAALFPYF
jgi:hypothetical protein